ncbi:MAG TPA: VCBS repeat-containing protein [Nocardioidaceae bacterium]|nr:VCBS repeat-containing protein [Nocardioidaceae bacterium]
MSVVVAVVLLSAAVVPVHGAGNRGDLFQAPGSPIAVDEAPFPVVAGDFNEDGDQDIATANRIGFTVSVALGDGAGEFSDAVSYPAGFDPMDMAAGDLNNDGHTDLVVMNDENNQQGQLDDVRTLLGNGDGTFAPFATPALFGPRPGAMALGEFTGDTFLDVVFTNTKSVTVGEPPTGMVQTSFELLPGLGNGVFGTATEFVDRESPNPISTGPFAIAVGHFDAGPTLDVALASTQTKDVSIWVGNGSGGFAKHGSPIATGKFAGDLVVGDFDGDADSDLALAHFSYFSVSILLNSGTGAFSLTPIELGHGVESLAAGDINDDGILDLATASQNTTSSSVLLGNGSGGFVSGWGSPHVVGTSRSVASADFDSDGLFDVAFASTAAEQAAVWLSVVDTEAPVTTTELSPASPDGNNGWYVSPVTATVSGQDLGPVGLTGMAELRCVLDPSSTPSEFADLAAGCPPGGDSDELLVDTDGVHQLYAAGEDLTGNTGLPTNTTVKIDGTAPELAPTITKSVLVQGEVASAAAHATDATSGVASSGCDPVVSSAVGSFSVTCMATDNAGNAATEDVPYTVIAKVYRPDLSLRKGSGPWVGGNQYGAGQSVNLPLARTGSTVTGWVRVENDGNVAGRVKVKGTASAKGFAVSYAIGANGVTRAVVAGTWKSPVLAPGQSVLLKVVVRRTSKVAEGATLRVVVRGTSMNDATRQDTVVGRVEAR